MAPTSLDQLGIVAQSVLDAAVDLLNTTAKRAPKSQFLTAARPAFDCEFVGVHVSLLGDDSTSPLAPLETKLRPHVGELILASFDIYVVRCGPDIGTRMPPTDAAKTANALTVLQDGWVLWNGIRAQQDELFDGCTGAYVDNGFPLPESGGYVGWQFLIRANIEGYTP